MIDIPDGVHRARLCEIRRGGEAWAFAGREQSAIRTHWKQRVAENPKFFNGPVFIMTSGGLKGDCLQGDLASTDFAASLYWRETGYRDKTVADCFGSAIIIGSDGTLIYGRQAPGHLNAGMLYPPGGFLDERDIGLDGVADLVASIEREIIEETGLDPATLGREPGYLVTRQGPLLSIGAIYRLAFPGDEFCTQINERLAKDATAELEALVALNSAADAGAHDMPGYARQIAIALLPG